MDSTTSLVIDTTSTTSNVILSDDVQPKPKEEVFYRFKTAEEFKIEYGLSWRYSKSWSSDMDHFLGCFFSGSQLPDKNKRNNYVIFSGYAVYDSFLTPITDDNEKKAVLAFKKKQDEMLSRITIEPFSNAAQLGFSFSYRHRQNAYNSIVACDFHSTPTNNCQLASIASFENLLNTIGDVSSIPEILTHVLLKAKWHKKLYFVDIHENCLNSEVEKLFYLPPTKYTSTNGSNMCYGLIKLDVNSLKLKLR